MMSKPAGYQEWYVKSLAHEHKRAVQANPNHLLGMKARLQELVDLNAEAPGRCAMSKEQMIHLANLIAEIETDQGVANAS